MAIAGYFLASVALVSIAYAIQLQATRDDARHDGRVGFGVNGHPLNPGSYQQMPLEQQLSRLKSIGLRTYRVNVNPEHIEKFDRLSELITLAEREGIRILPVVILPPAQYPDESEAYAAAEPAMYRLAKEFDSRIEVWELGNEYDLYCVKQGADGGSPADYSDQRYAVMRGLIRGMLEGLRHALEVLHDQFHKPIWVTEFDESSISPEIGPSSNPEQQGEALWVAMRELALTADRYHVVNADIYELLNEPQLLHAGGIAPSQAEFGILHADGEPTAASRAVQEFLETYHH